MNKLYLILTLTLFSLTTFSNENDSLLESTHMANNVLQQVKSTGKIESPCDSQLNNDKIILSDDFSLNGVNNGCEQFINKAGDYGNWGMAIVKSINDLPAEEAKKTFYSDNIPDMKIICPNFNNFNDELKKKFWVWTFAAISWQESSCNPKIKANGTNCQAIGLLQLEDSKRLREGRGDKCEVKDVSQAESNLGCGVDILYQQLLGSESSYFKTSTGELFWKGTYWQHLRFKKPSQAKVDKLIEDSKSNDNKTNIKELIMKFPTCR